MEGWNFHKSVSPWSDWKQKPERPTLVGGDEGDVLGGWRHTQYLVAINLPLNLRQVAEGAADAHRKVWDMADLQQKL